MPAKFFIFQMTPDLFRREPRNVGVVVEANGHTAARFFAEGLNGDIDGRRIKALPSPSAYRQWVKYWRRTLQKGGIPALVESAAEDRAHFQMIEGGDVDGIGDDSARRVADYLYGLLVSDGGLQEALGISPETEEALASSLNDEIIRALSARSIFAGNSDDLAFVPHPVRTGVRVEGSRGLPYEPDFVQQNGALWVIETVDLGMRGRERVKEHAGLAAYMFNDLRQRYGNEVQPIAVVRGDEAAVDDEASTFALRLLRNEGEIVRWWKPDEQSAFIAERQRVAMA